MASVVDTAQLIKALTDQGFNVEQPKFVRALRIAQNPGGCADCGAHTRIAVPVDPNDPEGPHVTSCCKKKAL